MPCALGMAEPARRLIAPDSSEAFQGLGDAFISMGLGVRIQYRADEISMRPWVL
jgi:hypothetical protein